MSANLVLTIAATRTKLSAGVTFDHLEVTVKDAAGTSASQSIGDNFGTSFSATFTSIADGPFSYSVSAVDNAGNTIGTPITGSGNTLAGTFPAPTGVTVTIS